MLLRRQHPRWSHHHRLKYVRLMPASSRFAAAGLHSRHRGVCSRGAGLPGQHKPSPPLFPVLQQIPTAEPDATCSKLSLDNIGQAAGILHQHDAGQPHLDGLRQPVAPPRG